MKERHVIPESVGYRGGWGLVVGGGIDLASPPPPHLPPTAPLSLITSPSRSFVSFLLFADVFLNLSYILQLRFNVCLSILILLLFYLWFDYFYFRYLRRLMFDLIKWGSIFPLSFKFYKSAIMIKKNCLVFKIQYFKRLKCSPLYLTISLNM